MTEQGTHFQYPPEFQQQIDERNNWTVDQWKEIVANWEDVDRQNFSFLLELDRGDREDIIISSYQLLEEWKDTDFDGFPEETRSIVEETLAESAFFSTFGSISDEARERVFEALTS